MGGGGAVKGTEDMTVSHYSSIPLTWGCKTSKKQSRRAVQAPSFKMRRASLDTITASQVSACKELNIHGPSRGGGDSAGLHAQLGGTQMVCTHSGVSSANAQTGTSLT